MAQAMIRHKKQKAPKTGGRVSDSILFRVYLLFGLFLMFGLIIVFRIIGLQLNSRYWLQRETEEKIEFKRQIAQRGSIIAEDGTILAASIPYYRIAMDPTIVDTAAIPNFKDSLFILAGNLAGKFGGTKVDTVWDSDTTFTLRQYKDTLESYYNILNAMRKADKHLYLIRRPVDFRELKEIKTWPILCRGRLKGGLIEEKIHNQRFYPFEELAKVTLGLMANDTTGLRGIEFAFNKQLRGRDGYMLVQKVAGRSYIPLDKYGEETTIEGLDIVTTLNVDMQDIVETALKRGVEQNAAKFGTAVLLDVATGQIKAIANYPEEYNHVIATRIEPGSTFKLVAAAVAMEDGIIDICDTIDTGNGTIMYDDKLVSDDKAYGRIPFESVFAHSSNVGMSKMIYQGYKDRPEKFLNRLRSFGFDEPANKQLEGEPKPIFYEPGDELWNMATLPSMAYGYSVEVTPLQMAAFYNAVANGGKRIRPWIIKGIRSNSQLIEEFYPEVIEQPILSPFTVEKLYAILEKVVTMGSAAGAFKGMPVSVAGKTGTVRKNINGQYVKEYRSSFGGFFPAEKPRYTCYIMIDEPAGSVISGARVAAPVFREIVERIYALDLESATRKEAEVGTTPRLTLPKIVKREFAIQMGRELGWKEETLPEGEWIAIQSDSLGMHSEPYAPADTLPDLRGMTSRDAIELVEKLGFRVRVVGSGKVRSQSLSPGFKIRKNVSITLYLG